VDPVAAYHEAVAGLEARRKGEMGTWSHRAVYWAAIYLQNDLMGLAYSAVKDRWAAILKAQMSQSSWADIPPPRKQLPPPGRSTTSRESAEAMIRELEDKGIVLRAIDKQAGEGFDCKRWARRIVEREERGDKSVTLLQSKYAREALGLAPTQEIPHL
jgi:hypothetical protein